MDDQLSEMYAVASLLSAIDTDDVGSEQVNATGSLLQRMIHKAQEISNEHVTLWRKELEEREKELEGSRRPITVRLESFDCNKVAIIKVIKDEFNLGLREAKDLVESSPIDVGTFASAAAERLKVMLENAGATVELH